jgi:hypothetical protein
MPLLRAAMRPSWLRRLGWLLVIWLASVLSLGLVAAALRLAMSAAGLRA